MTHYQIGHIEALVAHFYNIPPTIKIRFKARQPVVPFPNLLPKLSFINSHTS